MKFFVHIGVEKTGTTSIQSFLEANREALRRVGYFVPTSMGARNHRRLPVAAYAPDRRDEFTRQHALYTDDALLAYQRQVVADLVQELRDTACDKVVVSSEQIQSRLTTPAEVQRLKAVLEAAGATEIVVIVYLRDPAEIANSYYSTWIRCGATTPAPPGPADEKLAILCDHRATLERFASCFSEGAIRPRLFDSGAFRNGSLIDDFLEAIDCPALDAFVTPPSTNLALSPLGLEILRRFNARVPVFVSDRPNPLRGEIVRYVNEHFPATKTERYVMPEALFEAYREAFRDSNESVRARWFPARDRLFDERPYRAGRALAVPDGDLDRFVELLADIWGAKQARILALKERPSLGRRAAGFVKRQLAGMMRLKRVRAPTRRKALGRP